MIAEENNMMVVADSGSGDKFHIPSCKVIAVDNGNISTILVDIEHQDTDKYRIIVS
jgi:hypothetical protein